MKKRLLLGTFITVCVLTLIGISFDEKGMKMAEYVPIGTNGVVKIDKF
ncbi:hypothetical protein [Tumebacillus lipolyticus]|uniref:Uncharacterized protein n=1 Tax=Tumebacillus lipolyticus TaxID=1280370 RepID=A0ABW4ZSQ2_9BACL